MANEEAVKETQLEWKDFLARFRSDTENARQRIRKVNERLGMREILCRR